MTKNTINPNKVALLSSVATCLLFTSPQLAHSQVTGENTVGEVMGVELNTPPQPTANINAEPVLTEPPATPLAPAVENVIEDMGADVVDGGPVIVPHSGAYYDSSSFGGGTSLNGGTAPREVDPKYEPGSRFVVVERGSRAGSFSADLVAAQRALTLGRYSSALEIYERLYKKNPRSTRVLMGLAVAQQNSGFTESAVATYEELLRRDPNNTDATVNMLGLITSQNPSRAMSKLQKMWNRNNSNPAIAAQLGMTAAQLGDYEGAMRYLGIASSIEPNNSNHYYNMAVVSDRAGMVPTAIEYYEKSLTMSSRASDKSISRDVVYDRLAQLRRL